jgi:hypothetical protein
VAYLMPGTKSNNRQIYANALAIRKKSYLASEEREKEWKS